MAFLGAAATPGKFAAMNQILAAYEDDSDEWPPAQADPASPPHIEATQGSASQETPEKLYFNPRLGLSVPDVAMKRQQQQAKLVEPAAQALQALKECMTIEDVEKTLFLKASFDGLGTHLQIRNWVYGHLQQILDAETTHLDEDYDYDLRLGNPALWASALYRVAERAGVSAEALSACVDSAFGFLEHTRTTVATSQTAKHTIGTDAPCLIAAPPSSRKSRLISYTDDLLTKSAFASEELQNKKWFIGEASPKGIRTLLPLVCTLSRFLHGPVRHSFQKNLEDDRASPAVELTQKKPEHRLNSSQTNKFVFACVCPQNLLRQVERGAPTTCDLVSFPVAAKVELFSLHPLYRRRCQCHRHVAC